VLGPLRVVGPDGPVPLARPRERQLLCALVLHVGRTVSSEALAEALWGGEPPRSQRKALQTHVFRLRRAVGSTLLQTHGTGYAVDAEPDAVDAVRFERGIATLDAAAGPAGDRASLLQWWRGRAFDDLGDWPPAVLARRRLDEIRATAIEAGIADAVAQGGSPLAQIEGLLSEDPLRERLWMLLMIALYRSGRQAEALRAYERARKLLATELGVAPGPQLVDLERAVLDHNPRLLTEPPTAWLSRRVDADVPTHTIESSAANGRTALARGDPREAMIGFETALGAARGAHVDEAAVIDLLLELGEAATQAGEPGRAVQVAEEAASLARLRRDPVRFARAALTAVGQGWPSGLDPNAPAIGLLEEALQRLPDAPTHLRARLLAWLAAAEFHSRPVGAAREHSAEALSLARALDDNETTAIALYSRLLVDTDPLHTAGNIARAEELLAMGRQQSRTRWQAWALSVLPRYHACLGDIAQAERLFGELADLAERTSDLFAAHQASFGQLLRPTVEGDYDTAELAAERVRTAGERALIDPTATALAYWGAIGMLRWLQGRWHDVDVSPTMSWPQPTLNAMFHASIAAGRASENDLEGTREALSRVDPMSLADLPREMYWTSLIAMLAAACWHAHDTTRAAVLYEIATPHADMFVINPGCIFLGAMHHHLGLLAGTLNRDGAGVHLDTAVDLHRRVGAHIWVQRSKTALADLAAR
jgi:DNA-binding SARP family transcriptional activator